MRIVNLASGSKANSTLLEFGDTKILIDVGLPMSKLKTVLAEVGTRLEDIDAVCVTHEHVDHIYSLEQLAKHFDMNFYVHEKLKDSRAILEIPFKEGKLLTFSDKTFSVGDFEILPFAVSHDTICPVGFVVNVFKSRAKAGFVTDLGMVTESVVRALSGAKMVFIESNYDEEMLMGGRYPKIVKERIRGSQGHLSNEQSLELAKALFETGTKCFVLSHISQNNNTHELAYLNYANYFESQGLSLDSDVVIRLSFQERHGNNFNLKEEFDGK